MKKVILALTLLVVLAILLIPLKKVLAQEEMKECCTLRKRVTVDGVTCNAGTVAAPDSSAAGNCAGSWCSNSATTWGMFCLMNTIYTITDWIFLALVAIAIIMVLFGAFQIVTAGGVTEKVASGKNYILYAVIGFIIAILARAIPSIAKTIVGI